MKIIIAVILFFNTTFIFSQISIEVVNKLFYNIPLDTSFRNSFDFIKKSDQFEKLIYTHDSLDYLFTEIKNPLFLKCKPINAYCILLKDKFRHNLSINLRYKSNKKSSDEYQELKKILDIEACKSNNIIIKEKAEGWTEYNILSNINAILTIYKETESDLNGNKYKVVTIIIHY